MVSLVVLALPTVLASILLLLLVKVSPNHPAHHGKLNSVRRS